MLDLDIDVGRAACWDGVWCAQHAQEEAAWPGCAREGVVGGPEGGYRGDGDGHCCGLGLVVSGVEEVLRTGRLVSLFISQDRVISGSPVLISLLRT